MAIGKVVAQSGYELKIEYTEEISLPKKLEEFPSVFADSISVTQAAVNHIQALRAASFLMAEPLEIIWKEQTLISIQYPNQ